ncbi:hypothetical protein BJ508DRAFT_300298 [Ascobolus immersus RN42]|uniref:Uncharacterized protein n=1 Tax=Ascobolus immersus RN42 TaxID=1160509 RepID=A0A3N4IP21_ASCIM|nr:hypothetical protein BJ508DRAFT_300298 [Ascobolus immersus RN42]
MWSKGDVSEHHIGKEICRLSYKIFGRLERHSEHYLEVQFPCTSSAQHLQGSRHGLPPVDPPEVAVFTTCRPDIGQQVLTNITNRFCHPSSSPSNITAQVQIVRYTVILGFAKKQAVSRSAVGLRIKGDVAEYCIEKETRRLFYNHGDVARGGSDDIESAIIISTAVRGPQLSLR